MSSIYDKTESRTYLSPYNILLVELSTRVFNFQALDAVVEDLYRSYFATYGYAFPLTGKCMLLCSPLYGLLIPHKLQFKNKKYVSYFSFH